MNNPFYTQHQLRVFNEEILKTFVSYGFEVLDEPYIDYTLFGFRATYIRRYMLHKPTPYYDGILTTLIHVVGLPFGRRGQKMVILSAPRNLKNEPISETLKLRIHFNADGSYQVVHGDQQNSQLNSSSSSTVKLNGDRNRDDKLSSTPPAPSFSPPHGELMTQALQRNKSNQQLNSTLLSPSASYYLSNLSPEQQICNELTNYVKHIIETISPGLIELPTEMKLEILKKLNVDSIIKMSQVNNEFRVLIFKFGESLWRHLCYRDFRIKSINRMVHKSWLELYRDSYIMQQIEICRKERALPGLPERPALPAAPYRLQIEWLPEVMALPFPLPVHHHQEIFDMNL